MRWICTALLALAMPGCATLRGSGDQERELDNLWRNAHTAFSRQRFAEAEQGFRRLATDYPDTYQGREATFYVGSLRMDPRSPNWDPDSAAVALRRYLAQDSGSARRSLPRPEAVVLLELASQLNLPAGERVPELQPQVVVREPGVAPRIAPRLPSIPQTQALASENERLRSQLRERQRLIEAQEEELRRSRDELERIRKTLVPQRP